MMDIFSRPVTYYIFSLQYVFVLLKTLVVSTLHHVVLWIVKLADRFGEHLRSVEGYSHNSRYHGGGFPITEHFNLADHNNIQDMTVSVVKQVNGGTVPRQREERRVIFKLKTLASRGMNIEFL